MIWIIKFMKSILLNSTVVHFESNTSGKIFTDVNVQSILQSILGVVLLKLVFKVAVVCCMEPILMLVSAFTLYLWSEETVGQIQRVRSYLVWQ